MAKKVLLVEDDIDIQRVYNEKLTLEGFEVILAADSLTGFTQAKDVKPSIILLDIMLPGKMNGFDLLEKLKKDTSTSSIPVIVLTNLDTEKQSALKVGASDYLIKAQTELDTLVAKVKKFAK